MPLSWFNPRGPRTWEQKGRFYERIFAIKRWKDRLPDAARWFGCGFAKSMLAGTATDYLRRFICETWRGELCHWFAIGCAPIFFLWSPCWADLVMVGFALVANMPCILAQRCLNAGRIVVHTVALGAKRPHIHGCFRGLGYRRNYLENETK